MVQKFRIGEIAKFFNIPTSTLRYWEDKGVLHPKKGIDNQYREYFVEDLMTISDIIFYKNLGLQLKEIQEIEKCTPDEHNKLFIEKVEELKQEQKIISKRMKKLQSQINAVKIIELLKKHPYQITDIDTECVVSFELIEQEKLQQYIENPYLYTRVQHSNSLSLEKRGLTVPLNMIETFPKNSVIWKKRSNQYITFLMKEKVCEGYPNDLNEHLLHIQKSHRTGAIISRFLLCASEDETIYDFYQTFVEIISD